jgi:hypothetical protein
MTGSSACTGNGNTKYDAAADFVLPDPVGAGGRVERPTAGRLGPRRDICWVWGSADHPGSKLGQLDEGTYRPVDPQNGNGAGLTNPTQNRSAGLGRQCSLMTATRTVKVCGQELRVEVRPGERHRYAAVDVLRHWDQLRGFRSGGRCPRSGHCDRPGRRSGCRWLSGPGLALWFSGADPAAAVLLDELGCQRVDVLGFSWGGALAQQFAVQYRGRCRRLVLISTSPGLPSIPGRPQVVGKMLTPKRFRGGGPRRGPAVGGGHRQSR